MPSTAVSVPPVLTVAAQQAGTTAPAPAVVPATIPAPGLCVKPNDPPSLTLPDCPPTVATTIPTRTVQAAGPPIAGSTTTTTTLVATGGIDIPTAVDSQQVTAVVIRASSAHATSNSELPATGTETSLLLHLAAAVLACGVALLIGLRTVGRWTR